MYRHLATLAAVTALAGCTQSYNGSLLFDLPAPSPHEQERSQNQAQDQTEDRSQSRRTADLELLAAAIEPYPARAVSPAEQSGALFAPVVRSAGNPANISIFGHVGSTAAPGSSMDSNDNLRRVSFAEEGADFDPAVDASGEYLVFASTRHRQTSDLYRQRIGSKAVTQLTSDAGNDAMPEFSRDGSKIAFASDRTGNWDIYVMDAAGGQAVQVSHDPAHEIHPSFSPDGSRLAYCRLSDMSGQWEMVLIDLDRPGTPHFIGHGLMPTFSPSSDRLLFQRARQRGSRWFSVWSIDLVNGEPTAPTEIAVTSRAASITPSWSPDGKQIVFCTVMDPPADEQDRPAQADIWIADLDGSRWRQITSGPYRNLQPIWAGDGTIYFVSNREGLDNIWAVQNAGQGQSLAEAAQPAGTP